jgi:hypothetical protein
MLLKAFGRLAWRVVERIYIEHRLSVARVAFPHEDGATLPDFDVIYEELLELTRYSIVDAILPFISVDFPKTRFVSSFAAKQGS